MADYNQGRRFGNGSGQAGAFGFSGFGGQQSATTTNPFGTQATNTSSSFGGGQTNNTFGNTNTGGGLFGQANKPAGGSLFGTNNTSSSQPAGGLFSNSSNTNTGFGSFGAQQQEQPKTGFSFGNNANTGTGFGSGGTGFGANNTSNTGGGLFGNNQNTPAFGSGQPQQPQQNTNPFGGFGSNQQNQNQSTTNTGFGGFGQNNQQKPGSLFGSNTPTNTGGGLFGNNQSNQQQQPSGGLFSNNNQQQQQSGGSLFGKPASTGGGLFGNNASTATNNPGGGLFANTLGNNNANQNQQNQGGGLFGNNNQQQQKPGSLFGNAGSTGGGLFGNANNTQQQPAGGSLFGSTASTNNQQQQPGGLFGNSNNNNSSFLGMPQQQPNALAQPQTLQATILDKYPYGSASIFDGLPPPPQPSPAPMATPINRGSTAKKSIIPPTYKINPAQSQSRLVTPRRPMGYGFSYSTYGTPSSVGGTISTPGGFGGSLLHSSISRGLGKSLSTSNLRRSFDTDGESLLSPGAFSAGSSRYSGAGSMKRLHIDRSLRTDLFGNGSPAALPSPDKADQSKQPGILKKKVSFDTNTVGGKEDGQDGRLANNTGSNDTINSAEPSAQEQGFLRSSSRGNSKSTTRKTNGVASQLEMEQVKGNELAIVHEDGSPDSTTTSNNRPSGYRPQTDPKPGPYYMRPSRSEIEQMSQQQKSKVLNFEVGRQNCGRVVFNEPVDLNNVKLDEIFGNIAVITHRSITVYPDPDNKPSVGQGLNVPSTLYLENSWPRLRDRRTLSNEKSGPDFDRHVEKLRKVERTEFVDYDKDTGIWSFKVPHFTTYALDYEDTASEGDSLHTSTMSTDSTGPGTPTPKSRPMPRDTDSSKLSSLQSSTVSTDVPSNVSSSPYDTFEFRKRKILPGAFDESAAIYDDENMDDIKQDTESFLEDGSAVTPSEDGVDEPSELPGGAGAIDDRSLIIHDEEMEMAGSFPQQDAQELKSTMSNSTFMPKSILKITEQDADGLGTPRKFDFSATGDWAEELQKTISPRKQDRQALRESQAYALQKYESESEETPQVRLSQTSVGKELKTSIDLMNSLYGKDLARKGLRSTKQSSKGKDFEV